MLRIKSGISKFSKIKRLDGLTVCALLAIDDPILLEIGVELFLLDTLVLSEEVTQPDEVF